MKLRKILACVACASMLVACSGSSSTDSEYALSDGDTIKIGFIGPLTGDVSSYGIPVGNTVELVVEEYNNSDDAKYTIELVSEDTAGDESQATTAYNLMVSEGVLGIIGPVITAEGLAVGEASSEDLTPIISSSTTGDTITTDDDGNVKTNYFRVCSNDSKGGETIAKAISDGTIECTSVAILTNSDSDYSQGCTDSFVEQCEEDGTEIVLELSYPSTTADFSTYVDQVIDSGADVVYIPDYYETVATIVNKFVEKGYDGTFCGTDGWDGVLEIENVDKSIFNGSYYLTMFDDTTDEVQAYYEAYEEAYGSSTNMFGTMAYDATYILIEAIEACESSNPEDIIAALQETSYEGITGTIEFDEYNTPTKDLVVKTIIDGEYAYID